jgi:RimJ/RimL family protein N-acetyltransferase
MAMSSAGRRTKRSPEEREYVILLGELDALGQDIAAARRAARLATSGGLAFQKPREAGVPPHGEPVRLPDGSEILVRPIEPDDQHLLEVGFQHLGALSRYERFRGHTDRLTPKQLAYFTDVDHVTHEAFGAVDPHTGEGVGVVRYVRDPHEPRQAELACTVLDAWQERGVGSVLAERLAARARASGIERFTARLLVGNRRGRRLLAHVADELDESRYGGVVEIKAQLKAATDSS